MQSYVRGLQQYLYNDIIPLVEPDARRRARLVDASAMRTWIIAFTDESFNPNVGENYETLEKIGDSVLKTAFIEYLEKRFPDITQLELSEMVSHYLSKPELADISLRLGLDRWVRTHLEKNTHMFEDLLEAMFGALIRIGNGIQVGVGYNFALNLVISLFNPIQIDRSVSVGKPKTQVKQIFEKMHWGKVIEESAPMGELVVFNIYFTNEAMDHLEQLGIGYNQLIGTGSGRTKTIAGNNAYENALRELQRIGITQQWADEQRKLGDFESADLAAYYSDALAKLNREGLESMYFYNPRTSNKICYVQLIGVQPDGRKKVLVTTSVDPSTNNGKCSLADGKKQALQQYINQR